ncbi:MAG TPA: anthranilate phosphoribosyltransferase [Candidatus Acidoferrales bacterium]|nr:anthranilate phosphoribosyltransferase [Candidatus Acidoferrales bacterium]
MILDALEVISRGTNLSRAEADAAMEEILAGRAEDGQIVALLAGLREKGETIEELVGFATAMRRRAAPVFSAPRELTRERLVDTCGTGGDARGTFNISTCAAFVAAGAGARVAKHGNRSINSRSGSADVLEALGVRMSVSPLRMGEAVERVGIGFFFAPAVHTAMQHAMKARQQLQGRTVFNLLGPLTNPAGARAQVAGVFAAEFVDLVARALGELGAEHAFVVHGADGLDEISISGETQVAEVRDGAVRSYKVTPEDFGLRRAPLEEIAGGEPSVNAEMIRAVLDGRRDARRDVVLANAAAAIVAAGIAADFAGGARLAAESIDSGTARQKLDDLIAFCNQGG